MALIKEIIFAVCTILAFIAAWYHRETLKLIDIKRVESLPPEDREFAKKWPLPSILNEQGLKMLRVRNFFGIAFLSAVAIAAALEFLPSMFE